MKKIVSFVGLFFSGLAFSWGGKLCVATKRGDEFIHDAKEHGQLLIRKRGENWEVKYIEQDETCWMPDQITPVTQLLKRLAIFWRAAFF